MLDFITIVSGLPRSGTSLAMQMIAAGGIDPFTDGERQADVDNPKGYLELRRVRNLRQDASWLPEVRGKVVKVISHLLESLPSNEQYRIVFLKRNMEEVLVSQEKMLKRLGKPAAPSGAVRRAFTAHLAKFDRLISSRPEMSVLRLAYSETVANPRTAAEQIDMFLGQGLKVDAMAGAVDPSLYRNRIHE